MTGVFGVFTGALGVVGLNGVFGVFTGALGVVGLTGVFIGPKGLGILTGFFAGVALNGVFADATGLDINLDINLDLGSALVFGDFGILLWNFYVELVDLDLQSDKPEH